jgi:hypothetical protein
VIGALDPPTGKVWRDADQARGIEVVDLNAPLARLRHLCVDHGGVFGRTGSQDTSRLHVLKGLSAFLREAFDDLDAEGSEL